jgi:hypothetical protein
MKIYVGTANWGQEYGINKVKVPPKEIDKILEVADANDCGIETAWDYNCMEALRGLGDQFEIIFKCDEKKQLLEAKDAIGNFTLMKHHPPFTINNGSIYDTKDIGDFLNEVPYNIIDQRFGEHISTNPWVIARSVFIQGLAFGMPDFHGIPFYHLCWNFVRNNPNIDGIVVGVDTADQLKDILSIPNYEIDYSNIGGDGWIKTL